MSIDRHAGVVGRPRVTGPEAMVEAVLELGMVPFFENSIRGYSIEEMTPPEFWFEGDELGPWDWKIACVQSGEIAYGKFLWGGKAAFATVEFYRELMNYRRSLPKYQPDEAGRRIMDYVGENGSITIREVRGLLGVKKSAADAAVARLENQTRLVIGDMQRVYRGPDLHYNGWQTASFCRPEDLFDEIPPRAPLGRDDRVGVPGWDDRKGVLGRDDRVGVPAPFLVISSEGEAGVEKSPAESLAFLKAHVLRLAPHATERDIAKLLG